MAPKKALSECLKAKHFQGDRDVRAGLIAADEVIQAGGAGLLCVNRVGQRRLQGTSEQDLLSDHIDTAPVPFAADPCLPWGGVMPRGTSL